ncbi:hypothetical protein ACN6LI_006869, partial [Streptomyces violaceoruber]
MTNIPETGRSTRVQTRLVVIQILVLSLLATLGGRLWYLQIRQGDEYAEEASGNHVQQVVQPATRRAPCRRRRVRGHPPLLARPARAVRRRGVRLV